MTHAEKRAVTLYAALARDSMDFMDMLDESESEAIRWLYKILEAPPGPNTDAELNGLGSGIVRAHAKRRGIEL